MKYLKWGAIYTFSFCLFFSSCSNDPHDQIEDQNSVDFDNELLKTDDNYNPILKDKIFLELVDAHLTLTNLPYDRVELEILLAEDSENLQSYANAIGFESQEDFSMFFNEYNNNLLYIEDKYKISEMAFNDLQGLILKTPQYSTVTYDDCDRERRNCVGSASTIYGLEALGCSALNLTLVGGLVCYGLITSQYLISVDDCTLQWERCKD